MAIYVYHCNLCNRDFEKNVPIGKRDERQKCDCGRKADRKIVFTGSVWSPTANGGHK